MKKILLTLLFVFTLYAENNQTQELSLFDKQDGMLDVSDYLSQVYGFLPVPTIITEPAVGYGVGIGLIYFHDAFVGKKSASGRAIPASISVLFGMATENGTMVGAGAHIGYYKEDTIRTISVLGAADINIDTYLNDVPIAANIQGPVFYQAVKLRIKDSGLFLGAGYMYSTMKTNLDIPSPINDGRIELENEAVEAAAQLILEYDTRDNTLSPSSGYFINLKSNFFSEAVGGDSDFQRHMFKSYFYKPVTDKLNINLNITAETMEGDDAPFYAYPFIILRGMPMMAVQGQHILSSELELCLELTPRWEILAFGGVGKAFGDNQFGVNSKSFNDAASNYTGGAGFRYLVAKKFGLKMGLDIATSEYDNAFYIQVGSAWAGF